MGMFQERYGRKFGISKLLALSALATLTIAGINQTTHAALVASDNAGNYTLTQWTGTTPPNQGTGFQGWNIATEGSGSAGIYLATGIGAGGAIGTGSSNNSWGVYANDGGTTGNTGFIQIDRSFTNAANAGVGKLDPGQTFSIALSSDGVNSPYAIGFNLQSTGSTYESVFQMIFAGGNSDMQINDGSGSYTLTNVPFSAFGTGSGEQGGIVANITIGSAVAGGGYNYSLAVTNAARTTTYQTVSGRKTSSGQINQFQVFDSNAGPNMYFNSIAVTGSPISATPLPATFALVLAGGIALATMGLNRRRSNIKA